MRGSTQGHCPGSQARWRQLSEGTGGKQKGHRQPSGWVEKGEEDSEVQVDLVESSGGVRRGQAVGLVRADPASTQAAMPGARGLETWPVEGMWGWGLGAGKSSPTPRSPRTTLLNALAWALQKCFALVAGCRAFLGRISARGVSSAEGGC